MINLKRHGISLKLILATSLLFFVSYIVVSVYSYESSKEKLIAKILESELPGSLDIVYQVIQNKLDLGTQLATLLSEETLKEELNRSRPDVNQIIKRLGIISDRLNIEYLGVNTLDEYITPEGVDNTINYGERHYEHINKSQAVAFTQLDETSGRTIFWVGHAIRNDQDSLKGTVQLGFSIDELTASINNEITGEGKLYVIDQKGEIKISGDVRAKTAHLGAGSLKSFDELGGLSGLKQEILRSESLTTEYSDDEGVYYVGTKVVPAIDWFVIVEISESEMMAPIYNQFVTNLLIGFGVTLLTILLCAFLVRTLVAVPLLHFQKGLSHFFDFLNRESSQAELIENPGDDEIGAMVKMVNSNIKAIELGIQNDNRLIAEVTGALDQIQQGNLAISLDEEGFNPELKKLKQTFDHMIVILQEMVGRNINVILEIMKEYGELNFTKKPDSTPGEIEKQVVIMGERIARAIEEIKEADAKIKEQTEKIKSQNKDLQLSRDQAESALEELKSTQTQMIQSEKLATLGQLMAGIAHEVNSPLGAINASSENIQYAVEKAGYLLPRVIKILTPELMEGFFLLIKDNLTTERPTSREVRKLRRGLERRLEDLGVENADELADTLTEMNIFEVYEEIMPLIMHKHAGRIFEAALNLSLVRISNENIHQAVQRASKIVFALKKYSHQNAYEEMTSTDVQDNIDTVLTIYYNQMKYGVELVKNYEEVPEIKAYPDELNQVWTNLLHNALHAMSFEGKLEITVKQEGDEIVVAMKDTGGGIPEDIREKVFTPFFTTKKEGEGTGLGLDIVKKIIDKHQGSISFECEPDVGTTFFVRLPVNMAISDAGKESIEINQQEEEFTNT